MVAPQPGVYRLTFSTVSEAVQESGELTLEVVAQEDGARSWTYVDEAGTQTGGVLTLSDPRGMFTVHEDFSHLSPGLECAWSPPLIRYPALLTPGVAWESASSCETALPSGSVTLRYEETATAGQLAHLGDGTPIIDINRRGTFEFIIDGPIPTTTTTEVAIAERFVPSWGLSIIESTVQQGLSGVEVTTTREVVD